MVVALSAEKNQGGPLAVASVSLGGQVLTEVFDFTVGSATAYHNLHWFGYLLESEIQLLTSASLTIADDSLNSFTGTLGVGALAPSWISRSAGLKIAAGVAIILDDDSETVSHNAYWFNTAAVGVSVVLQEKDRTEK